MKRAANNGAVYLVEGDTASRHDLTNLLQAEGLTVRPFDTASALLAADRSQPGAALLCCPLPDLPLLELLYQINAAGAYFPAVIVGRLTEVGAVIEAVKAGTVDLLEKPYDLPRLIDSTRRAVALGCFEHRCRRILGEIERRFRLLTFEEKEVMRMLAAGRQNKAIALDLDVSVRTVEYRRASVFEKLEVHSIQELVTLTVLREQLRERARHRPSNLSQPPHWPDLDAFPLPQWWHDAAATTTVWE